MFLVRSAEEPESSGLYSRLDENPSRKTLCLLRRQFFVRLHLPRNWRLKQLFNFLGKEPRGDDRGQPGSRREIPRRYSYDVREIAIFEIRSVKFSFSRSLEREKIIRVRDDTTVFFTVRSLFSLFRRSLIYSNNILFYPRFIPRLVEFPFICI